MDSDLRKEIVELIQSLVSQDSIEIGTPAKGGSLKVYGNLSDEKDFESRLSKGLVLMKKANVEYKQE